LRGEYGGETGDDEGEDEAEFHREEGWPSLGAVEGGSARPERRRARARACEAGAVDGSVMVRPVGGRSEAEWRYLAARFTWPARRAAISHARPSSLRRGRAKSCAA
jgi:hypothetical protein